MVAHRSCSPQAADAERAGAVAGCSARRRRRRPPRPRPPRRARRCRRPGTGSPRRSRAIGASGADRNSRSMLKCLNSSPRASRMIAIACGSRSTAIRCSYQPIASASSVNDAHSRANVRVSAGSSSGGSWYWSKPMSSPGRGGLRWVEALTYPAWARTFRLCGCGIIGGDHGRRRADSDEVAARVATAPAGRNRADRGIRRGRGQRVAAVGRGRDGGVRTDLHRGLAQARRPARRAVSSTGVGLAAFALSHVLAMVIGAWPSVLVVSAVTAALCWRLSDSRRGGLSRRAAAG